MKEIIIRLEKQMMSGKKYFLMNQPRFLFLLILLCFLLGLRQTGFFVSILNIQLITFTIWLAAVAVLKFSSRQSFIMSFFFLVLASTLTLSGMLTLVAERMAEYTFGFLLIGMIQELWSLRLSKS